MKLRSFEHPLDMLNDAQIKEFTDCANCWESCKCGIDLVLSDCIERARSKDEVPAMLDKARKALGYPRQ